MRIAIEEAATCFEELADRALAGEEIIITRPSGRDVRLERIPDDELAGVMSRLDPPGD